VRRESVQHQNRAQVRLVARQAHTSEDPKGCGDVSQDFRINGHPRNAGIQMNGRLPSVQASAARAGNSLTCDCGHPHWWASARMQASALRG
jgi:hypothetical protein